MPAQQPPAQDPNAPPLNPAPPQPPTVEQVVMEHQRQMEQMQQQLAQQAQAIQHAQHQAAQASASSAHKESIKPPKPDVFDGRHVDTFLYALEKLFAYHGESRSDQKVSLAVTFLRSSALRWYKYAEHQDVEGKLKNWAQFTQALRSHFQATNTETMVRNKLAVLQQVASVSRYNDQYNTLIIEVLDVDERSKVDMYVRGLKKEIQLHVSLQSPETLEAAQRLALNIDTIMLQTGYARQPARQNFRGKGNGRYSNNRNGGGRSYGNYGQSVPMELGQAEHESATDEYDVEDSSTVTLAQANYKGSRRLAPEEQRRLMKEGRCFNCQETGHLSRDCPNRTQSTHQKND